MIVRRLAANHGPTDVWPLLLYHIVRQSVCLFRDYDLLEIGIP